MSDIPLGNVPSSTLDETSNFIITKGDKTYKEPSADVKKDFIGEAILTTTAPKPLEAINELNQDLLEATGYGVISGGVVSAQSTPNMTVNVTACILKTSTGSRQTPASNNSLTITAADTTNPRIDIVYVNSSGVISYLQGTAAASPIAPAIPTGGLLLAQITVVANATSIINLNITDKRKMLNTTDALASQLSDVAHKTGTLQTNLNSDKIDGYDAGNASGNIPVSNGTVNTNLNADLLDGQHGAYYAPLASPNFTGTPQISSKNIATLDVLTFPTLLNGWVKSIGDMNNTIVKNGNIVTVTASINGGTSSDGTVILTLPTGYRPNNNMVIGGAFDWTTRTNGVSFITVSTTGNILIRSGFNSTDIFVLSFSFPLGV